MLLVIIVVIHTFVFQNSLGAAVADIPLDENIQQCISWQIFADMESYLVYLGIQSSLFELLFLSVMLIFIIKMPLAQSQLKFEYALKVLGLIPDPLLVFSMLRI